MRTLTAHFFISLDGVIDAPQNWHFPYANHELMSIVGDAMEGVDAILLGRRTFDEWKAFWPQQSGFPLADFINGTHKYVASNTLTDAGWSPATILAGDIVDQVSSLKSQGGGNITINGSGTLTRTLLSAGLIDELHLLVHPLVVGTGKHLFESGEAPLGLDLTHHRRFDNDVTYQVFTLAAETKSAA